MISRWLNDDVLEPGAAAQAARRRGRAHPGPARRRLGAAERQRLGRDHRRLAGPSRSPRTSRPPGVTLDADAAQADRRGPRPGRGARPGQDPVAAHAGLLSRAGRGRPDRRRRSAVVLGELLADLHLGLGQPHEPHLQRAHHGVVGRALGARRGTGGRARGAAGSAAAPCRATTSRIVPSSTRVADGGELSSCRSSRGPSSRPAAGPSARRSENRLSTKSRMNRRTGPWSRARQVALVAGLHRLRASCWLDSPRAARWAAASPCGCAAPWRGPGRRPRPPCATAWAGPCRRPWRVGRRSVGGGLGLGATEQRGRLRVRAGTTGAGQPTRPASSRRLGVCA